MTSETIISARSAALRSASLLWQKGPPHRHGGAGVKSKQKPPAAGAASSASSSYHALYPLSTPDLISCICKHHSAGHPSGNQLAGDQQAAFEIGIGSWLLHEPELVFLPVALRDHSVE